MIATASEVPSRSARATSPASRSWNAPLLARPVSASVAARRSSAARLDALAMARRMQSAKRYSTRSASAFSTPGRKAATLIAPQGRPERTIGADAATR